MKPFKTLLLAGIAFVALSAPVYAEEGHDEKPHFSVTKPETVESAWAMIDETISTARQALKDNNADILHEAGEKLAAAVATLHDHPQAVKEENGEKLTQALDQLTKTVDRFHHAAEDKNTAGATETLDLFEKCLQEL